MSYGKTTPCDNCPFRTDIPGYLSSDRVEEIATNDGEFPCHKTTNHDDDTGERVSSGKEVMCAGFLIFREKTSGPNQMMRIAERLRLYDPEGLDMEAPVYDSLEEMKEAQP